MAMVHAWRARQTRVAWRAANPRCPDRSRQARIVSVCDTHPAESRSQSFL